MVHKVLPNLVSVYYFSLKNTRSPSYFPQQTISQLLELGPLHSAAISTHCITHLCTLAHTYTYSLQTNLFSILPNSQGPTLMNVNLVFLLYCLIVSSLFLSEHFFLVTAQLYDYQFSICSSLESSTNIEDLSFLFTSLCHMTGTVGIHIQYMLKQNWENYRCNYKLQQMCYI